MSIKVNVNELPEALERFGWQPFVVTTSDDGRPHMTHTELRRDEHGYTVVVGQRTVANASARPSVALLWPSPAPGTHSLIADAEASVVSGADEPTLRLIITGAVQHRPAGATSC